MNFSVPNAYTMAPAAAPGAPALSFDVTEANFEAAVLERSLQVPVLLDCWAPWCGPCKSLGPVLEKLVQAYGGRFVLAKLDTDRAPQLSAALQIRSIPLVVLFVGGQMVDQFTGALPEGQLRAFLDKHLPPMCRRRMNCARRPPRRPTPRLPKRCCRKPWPCNPAMPKPRWTWPNG
jgi:thioredoxin